MAKAVDYFELPLGWFTGHVATMSLPSTFGYFCQEHILLPFIAMNDLLHGTSNTSTQKD